MADNKKYIVAQKFRVRESGKVYEIGQAANQFSQSKTQEYLDKGLIEVDKEATKAANEPIKESKKEDKK